MSDAVRLTGTLTTREEQTALYSRVWELERQLARATVERDNLREVNARLRTSLAEAKAQRRTRRKP